MTYLTHFICFIFGACFGLLTAGILAAQKQNFHQHQKEKKINDLVGDYSREE